MEGKPEPFSPGIQRKFNIFCNRLAEDNPRPDVPTSNDQKRFWDLVILSSYNPAKVTADDIKFALLARGMKEEMANYWAERFRVGYEILLYRKYGVLDREDVIEMRKNGQY